MPQTRHNNLLVVYICTTLKEYPTQRICHIPWNNDEHFHAFDSTALQPLRLVTLHLMDNLCDHLVLSACAYSVVSFLQLHVMKPALDVVK